MRIGLTCLMFIVAACDQPQAPAPAPELRTEFDQQVKRLREDMEIELQDLRGRWLATEGLLTKQRDTLKKQRAALDEAKQQSADLIQALELELDAVTQDLEAVRRQVLAPTPENDELGRLARSYEEIYCLRKQGAEESVASVYQRYGFASPDDWARAWQAASRSESFQRNLSARVERLCP